MTQNRKVSKWLQSIKETYERSEADYITDKARVRAGDIKAQEQYEKTEDKTLRLILSINRRVDATFLLLESESVLSKLQDYMLALQVARLEMMAKGSKPSPALDDKIKKAKKAIDTHIAKRLGQIFDDKNMGYIG